MQVVDNVTELMRIPFLSGYDLDITVFLNMLNYLIYKNKKIEEQYKKK